MSGHRHVRIICLCKELPEVRRGPAVRGHGWALPIYNFGQAVGFYFLLMEFVESGHLSLGGVLYGPIIVRYVFGRDLNTQDHAAS